MPVWVLYVALLAALIIGWLFGFEFGGLAARDRVAAAKADLEAAAARAKDLAEGATELEEARSRIEELELETTKLGEVAARVPELEGALPALRDELSQVSEARAAAEARATALAAAATELEEARSRIEALELETTKLREPAARVPGLEGALSALRDELSQVSEARVSAEGREANLGTALDVVGAELAHVRSHLATVQIENARIQSEGERLSAVETALVETRAELARQHEIRLAALKSAERLEDAEALLQFLRSKVTSLSDENTRLEAATALVPSLQQTVADQRAQLDELRAELDQEKAENARVTARLAGVVERVSERDAMLEEAQRRFGAAAAAHSAETVESSRQAFLGEARAAIAELHGSVGDALDVQGRALEGSLGEMREAFAQLQAELRQLQVSRLEDRVALRDGLEGLRAAREALRLAATSSAQPGRVQGSTQRHTPVPLSRLVEIMGLSERSVEEPVSFVPREDGLGADAVLRLPGGRATAVETRVPLDTYFASQWVEEENFRKELLKSHAAQVRQSMEQLALAHRTLASNHGLVILYIPVEGAVAAALEEDPDLISYAMGSSVIPAGPLTLLAHVKTALALEAAERRD